MPKLFFPWYFFPELSLRGQVAVFDGFAGGQREIVNQVNIGVHHDYKTTLLLFKK